MTFCIISKIGLPVLLAVLACFCFPGRLHAKESRINFSVATGYYSPSLKSLNNVLTNKQIAISEDPNFLLPGRVDPNNEPFKRNFETEAFKGGNTYGIEMSVNIHKRHELLISVSVWESEISGQDTYELPLRTFRDPVIAPRFVRYDLEISQIWLGWRYNLFDGTTKKGRKMRLFSTAELFGVSLGYLTMDSLLKVNAPRQGQSFASVSSTEAFGLGYTSRFGVGAEYYITKLVSFSVRSSFVIGKIDKFKIKRYFPPSFPPDINTGAPQAQNGVSITPPKALSEKDTLMMGTDASNNIERNLGTSERFQLELNGMEADIALMFHF